MKKKRFFAIIFCLLAADVKLHLRRKSTIINLTLQAVQLSAIDLRDA
jgi:hypothetical protein